MKGFVVYLDDGNAGMAVVAVSLEEAKEFVSAEIGIPVRDLEGCAEPYELNPKEIAGLPPGVVEGAEGLKRGIYSWADGICPLCGELGTLTNYDGPVTCGRCEEKALEAWLANEAKG